ncbi:hypothetical protein SMICM304S_01611 [Streptomyces microflavus]
MLTQTTTRVLEPSDLGAALAILESEPVANAFVASRVQVAGLDPWRLGGEMWGWYADGRLRSLCYAGANLVPICAGPEAVRAFADRARRAGRRCSSIVGPAEPTALLWRLLEPGWGPAREVRANQPLMVTESPSADVTPDPLVRRIRKDETEVLMPACVAMFTEEVGIPRWPATADSSTRPGSPNSSAPAAPSPGSTTARSSSRPRSAPPPPRPARSRASGSPPNTAARASPRPAWPPSCATPWPMSPPSSACT